MGGAVFPPYCLTWDQTKVEVMKIMVTSFRRSYSCTAALSAPSPAAGYCRPRSPWETPGNSQESLGQSLVGSLLLFSGSWCTQGFFCALQESVFPVLCKFCNQIPLSSKVKFPGGSQSLCQIPRLGNLSWIYVIKHLSKPIECTTLRVNPNINCGHWMIMMCQGRLTSYNSVPSWWGMLMMKEATHM